MSLRGPEALASIEEALRDIRREEDDLSRRLARSAERVGKFRETEAELFRQLARIRLAPDVQGEIDGTLSHAEAEARRMLVTHTDNLASAEKRLADIETDLTRLTGLRTETAAELQARQAELDALADTIEKDLAADPDYAAADRKAEHLREVAAQSFEKAAQAEADQREKGQPYRDDPLFIYLFNRDYGTSAYEAGNLVRYLDGLVAAHIGYRRIRPNYVMLNEIPERLREHAERQEQAAEDADAELAMREERAVDAAGGRPIREAIEETEARLGQIDEDILDAEDNRDEAASALSGLAEGADPAFETALDLLATGLRREDVQALLADARRTATGHDDTIVAQIDDARARAREEEAEAREQKERLKVLATRRRELEDIQWEFKKARFDDPRSSFGEDKLVGDMLNDFLRGAISASTYWGHWQRSQNWGSGGMADRFGGARPPRSRSRSSTPASSGFEWPDTSFGGSRKRRRSTGGFGGGWGAPRGGSRKRTGKRGTRKHSGFKTGGGF